eukprot:scpid45097/ scgid19341/ 
MTSLRSLSMDCPWMFHAVCEDSGQHPGCSHGYTLLPPPTLLPCRRAFLHNSICCVCACVSQEPCSNPVLFCPAACRARTAGCYLENSHHPLPQPVAGRLADRLVVKAC